MATIVYEGPGSHVSFGGTGQELYGEQTATVRWQVDNAGNAPGEALLYVSPAVDQVTSTQWQTVPAGGSTILEASYGIGAGLSLLTVALAR